MIAIRYDDAYCMWYNYFFKFYVFDVTIYVWVIILNMARKNEAKWKRIVASVKAGSKGGKPGQWSARKAQLATLRYKKSGGTYTGPKTKAQKSLSKWTKEKWGTKSGKNSTQGDKATGERYLPKKVREGLTKKEYEKTSAKKRADTKKGKQVSKQPKRIAKKTSKLKGANMKGDPVKDKELRNKLLRIKGGNQLDIYDLEKKEYVKKTGYLPPSSVKNITEMKLSNEVTKNKPNSYSEMNSYSKRKEVLKPPTTRSMGMERTTYSVIGNINDSSKNPVSRNDFYIPGAKNSIGYKEFAKNKNIVREVENKIKGANMKGVPHYRKDGTEYKGATHKHPGKGLMSGKKHTSSSVNLFHKDEIPGPNLVGNQSKIDMNRDGKITKKDFDMLNRGPSMQGSWMRKHVKG